MMLMLALFLLTGLITTLGGLAIFIGFILVSPHLANAAGVILILFGCVVFGGSWLLARLASTVTFDLKQKIITIIPKWNFGIKYSYSFDEVQSLHAAKCLVGVLPLLITWRFFFILRTGTKITIGETYNATRRDVFIRDCTDKISSETGINSQVEYKLKHVLFL